MLFSVRGFYCRSKGRRFNRKRFPSLPYMLRDLQYTSLLSVYDLFSQSNIQYDEAFSDNIFLRKYSSLVLLKSSTDIFIIISIII